jgi:uncharacterized membrane protein YeaQ/YmgE (transglycosylase-associated protein family)
MLILAILVIGMASGWVAQVMTGRSTSDRGEALVAGLTGSLLGGVIGSLLAGDPLTFGPSGLIGSIVGAIVVLAIRGAIQGRRRSTG